MQRNVEKYREIQRNVEKRIEKKRNVEKCRYIQRNAVWNAILKQRLAALGGRYTEEAIERIGSSLNLHLH